MKKSIISFITILMILCLSLTVFADGGIGAVTSEASAPRSISLNASKVTKAKGETFQLKVIQEGVSVKWTSSNKKLATVDNEGNVKILGTSGTVTITAKDSAKHSAKCTITVKKAPIKGKMQLNKSSLSLDIGKTQKLSVSFSSGYAGSYVWESSDESIASVSSNGTVTAQGYGKAIISAKAFNGFKVSCTVNVYKVLTVNDVTYNVGDSIILGVNEKTTIKPSYDKDLFKTSFTYSSSKKAVATVSSSGLITPQKAGTAIITVKSANGVTKKISVTVKKAPSKITLNKTSLRLEQGEEFDLKATLSSGSAGKITWKSSDTSVATVDSNGHVKAIADNGHSAVITAKTYNGKTAKCTVVSGTLYITKIVRGEEIKCKVSSMEEAQSIASKYNLEVVSLSGDTAIFTSADGMHPLTNLYLDASPITALSSLIKTANGEGIPFEINWHKYPFDAILLM